MLSIVCLVVILSQTSVLSAGGVSSESPHTVVRTGDTLICIDDSGRADINFDGFADGEGERWKITQGLVDTSYNDIVYESGEWRYYCEGKYRKDYTGLSDFPNAYGWWYVKNGKVDFKYTGFADNVNGRWKVEDSKVSFSYNDIVYESGEWRYYCDGKYRNDFTGLSDFPNQYGWWYIKNGRVDFNYNYAAANKNGTWKVTKGAVDFGYNGYAYDENGTKYLLQRGCAEHMYLNILMIGNSLTVTTGKSCVDMLSQMIGENGQYATIDYVAGDGMSISDHVDGRGKDELNALLASKKYDVIVLQDESENAAGIFSGFYDGIYAAMKRLSEYGQLPAIVILYSTNGCTHMKGYSYTVYADRTYINNEAAKHWINLNYPDVNADVANATELHYMVRCLCPEVSLMTADGNHPVYLGYYLSALRIYKAIYGIAPSSVDQSMVRYRDLSAQKMNISSDYIRIKKGETSKLTASDPYGGSMNWYSLDMSTATVSEGTVTAKSAGWTVIGVRSSNGFYSACVVEVYE